MKNNRYETNKILLKKLETYIETYKDQRFGQIISNYGFIPVGDPFYEESDITLSRIEAMEELRKRDVKIKKNLQY